MKRISGTLLAMMAVGACAASTTAFAENPAGFYLGAGLGWSTVRSDDAPYGLPGYYNDSQFAWKGIVGVRPIPFLGAEFEYIDFGQPSIHGGYYSTAYYGYDSHPRAATLFGVGYLPVGIPLLDVLLKAGVARLETDVTTTVPPPLVSPCPTSGCSNFPITYRHNETNDKFAYGVGVQSRVWGVAFRAEYERISSSYGDPDAFTVSATWTF